MVTTSAAPKFFRVPLPSALHAMNKPTICNGGVNEGLAGGGNQLNFFPASGLQMKRKNLSHFENRGYTPAVERSSSAEHKKSKQKTNNDERLLEEGLVFRKNFTIRSFQIGSDFKLSIEALMSYLQEMTLSHLKSLGIVAGGFGLTPEMVARDLIWVVYRHNIEVDHYPSWEDAIQISTWIYRSGKTAIGRQWHIADLKTGRTLIQANGLFAMMNKRTRKLAKLEEVIGDLNPFLMECDPIIHKDCRKILHLDTDKADYVRTGLTPAWMDIDANQHVSHIKLVNYVLESVPCSIVESHELSSMTFEYRKECNGTSVLQSLSKIITDTSSSDHARDNEEFEFDHLLRLECGSEIVRGRTRWRPKYTD